MQITCATKHTATEVLLLLMTAGHSSIRVYGSSPDESLSPPFIITLPQLLDAALRTQIERVPDTRIFFG